MVKNSTDSPQSRRVILGVCGSIAAYKACDIIRQLQAAGWTVQVVMTAEAARFITPLTLGTLAGTEVLSDMFEGQAWRMAHIDLSRSADVILIAPATANVIGKIANGLADDILTALALTARIPILIAPAMNDEMYTNAIVKENCAKLVKHDMRFIEPVEGKLACGVVGIGHLAAVEDIVKAVMKS